MLFGRAALIPLTLLLVLCAAGAAQGASKIVYECGADLCAVDPVTGIGSKVTSDGASYRRPSLSADGAKLAASRGQTAVVGAFGGNLTESWAASQGLNGVALAPSGAALAESHSYVTTRYGCPLTGGCLELVDESGGTYSVGPLGVGGKRGFRGGGGVGFLGNGSLLTSWYTRSSDTHTICALADPLVPGSPCAAQVNSVGRVLADPAGSPDSKLIAATTGVLAGAALHEVAINLYDAASGAFLGTLAAGGSDPAFSPDSSEIAYSGADGWVHVVSVDGRRDRKLVAGGDPTWGGAPAPRVAGLPGSLKYRRGAVKVPLRCAGATPCAGRVQLRKGKATLGSAVFKLAPGKRRAVAVKPGKRGRKVISSVAKQRLTLRIALTGGGTVTKKLTLRR